MHLACEDGKVATLALGWEMGTVCGARCEPDIPGKKVARKTPTHRRATIPTIGRKRDAVRLFEPTYRVIYLLGVLFKRRLNQLPSSCDKNETLLPPL